jgi:Na+-translocating ferredoxin:NAD+ oxidoreductase subunit B
VADYNKVRQLVERQDIIALCECICRKEQRIMGKECDRPKETCLAFGDFARYYIDNGLSRAITATQALRVLDTAEKSGLVLSPTNTQEIQAICCCCPCCCPITKTAKMMSRPAKMVHSYYFAAIDQALCSACGQCIQRCPMDAIKESENRSEVIDGRCIGCGLCISTCPETAIALLPKQAMEAPPMTLKETLNRIENERLFRKRAVKAKDSP